MADTWDSFFKKMNKVVEDATDIVSREVSELLREMLYGMWYLKNQESTYSRTFELVNSIKTKKSESNGKNSYITEVFFDNNELSRGNQSTSPWTQHSSMVDGSDIEAGALAWILDQGANTPFHIFHGVNYVDATIKGLFEIRGRVERKMKLKGYDVKVHF